jgi:tetratricopeptide (TPR) repeat protein
MFNYTITQEAWMRNTLSLRRDPDLKVRLVGDGAGWKILGVAIFFMFVAGCTDDASKQQLNEGYSSLEARQYDQAISQADTFLQKNPTGAGSAEALYLRGRAIEEKLVNTPTPQAQVNAQLQTARECYIQALSRNPSPQLEAYIHTSLANVAYFQEDYATAANEWTIAYDKLNDATTKAWVLYRVGISRQRLGEFSEADKIFAAVQDRFPNTIQSQRAREHQGVHGFSVQIGTFANGASADNAILSLRREGVLAHKQADAKGRSVVMAGPFGSYQQAESIKTRYAAKYPGMIIVP